MEIHHVLIWVVFDQMFQNSQNIPEYVLAAIFNFGVLALDELVLQGRYAQIENCQATENIGVEIAGPAPKAFIVILETFRSGFEQRKRFAKKLEKAANRGHSIERVRNS